MERKENENYLDKVEEIRGNVYEFYNMSGRGDLIMVYEMQEDKIYSYIYKDYLNSLNLRSRQLLKEQYAEAKVSGKIVLFIKDKLREKLKSFTV